MALENGADGSHTITSKVSDWLRLLVAQMKVLFNTGHGWRKGNIPQFHKLDSPVSTIFVTNLQISVSSPDHWMHSERYQITYVKSGSNGVATASPNGSAGLDQPPPGESHGAESSPHHLFRGANDGWFDHVCWDCSWSHFELSCPDTKSNLRRFEVLKWATLWIHQQIPMMPKTTAATQHFFALLLLLFGVLCTTLHTHSTQHTHGSHLLFFFAPASLFFSGSFAHYFPSGYCEEVWRRFLGDSREF